MITPSQILNISEENNYFFLSFYDRNLATVIDDVERSYGGSCAEVELYILEDNYHTLFPFD